MSKDDYPGKRVIEAIGLEAEMHRDVDFYFREYDANGRVSADKALRALRLIQNDTATREGSLDEDWAGIRPDTPVPVPWWIVAVISERWAEYLGLDGIKTLGQAFDVEGRGQGKHRAVSVRDTERDHWGYALEVAYEHETGAARSVTDAIGTVAERWEKSYDTIHDVWKAHGKVSRAAVKKGVKVSKSTP